jgi:hypothetical protein
MSPIGEGQENERSKVNFAFEVPVYQLIGFTLRLLDPGRRSCIRRTSARSLKKLR